MDVIRHEQEKMRPPEKAILAVSNCFKDPGGNGRHGELIWPSHSAVDCDEEDLTRGVNPRWNIMGQVLASKRGHDGSICQGGLAEQHT